MADLGKVGITYDKNGYIATTPYEPLTVLKYTDGGTYMSILPTTGHLPTDTTYWACMVPPAEASVIDYTPLAGGVITNTTVQGAIEQADSLKFNKASVVQTNVNDASKVPSSALLYSVNAALTNLANGKISTAAMTNVNVNDATKVPTAALTYAQNNALNTRCDILDTNVAQCEVKGTCFRIDGSYVSNADSVDDGKLYATNPSTANANEWGYLYSVGRGTWKFQLWFRTDGYIGYRKNINSGGWSAWQYLSKS